MSIDATTEFFTAYLEVLMYARADEVSQYGKPTDKSRCVCVFVRACTHNHAIDHTIIISTSHRWYLPPTVVNAYYSPSFNKFGQ